MSVKFKSWWVPKDGEAPVADVAGGTVGRVGCGGDIVGDDPTSSLRIDADNFVTLIGGDGGGCCG